MSIPNGTQGGEDETKKSQEEQMRRDVMSTVLDTAARERCTSKHGFCSSLQLVASLKLHFLPLWLYLLCLLLCEYDLSITHRASQP